MQAVKEAKQDMTKLDNTKAQLQNSDVSAELLAKFFRRASSRSVEMAKARLTMEAAVQKAEQMLLEKKHASVAHVASIDEQA